MTAASSISYNLRLKKSIERSIFIDLLQHTGQAVAPNAVVYISMGGPYVQDQADVHTALGWKHLISFDSEEWVIKRQEFNRPVSCIKCLNVSTDEIINDLTNFWTTNIDDRNCVIWFDYTESRRRGAQLREARAVMPKLKHGDILKITLNARLSTLGLPKDGTPLDEYRLQVLRNQLAEYFPATTEATEMNETDLPSVLGRAFAIACDEGVTSGFEFLPLTAFRYSDTDQMATFCGVVLDSVKKERYIEKIRQFAFRATSFEDVTEIDVPSLSLREKIEIDRLIFSMDPDGLRNKINLSLAETDVETNDLVSQYKTFYRFYPKFARISAV